MRRRVFLLSPAHCGGVRARMVFNPTARFDLAVRLRRPEGAPLGEVFSFLSGLYFRGKLAYARGVRAAAGGAPGVLVITPTDGLVPAAEPVTSRGCAASPRGDRRPATRATRAAAARRAPARGRAGAARDVVLLGSIATGKYVDVLAAFGERLLFPADFVGRGDMSRGGLLLRCARARAELDTWRVRGALRHGPAAAAPGRGRVATASARAAAAPRAPAGIIPAGPRHGGGTAGREVRADQSAQAVLAGARHHQGGPAPLLRGGRARTPAAPARPRDGDEALPERRGRRSSS